MVRRTDVLRNIMKLRNYFGDKDWHPYNYESMMANSGLNAMNIKNMLEAGILAVKPIPGRGKQRLYRWVGKSPSHEMVEVVMKARPTKSRPAQIDDGISKLRADINNAAAQVEVHEEPDSPRFISLFEYMIDGDYLHVKMHRSLKEDNDSASVIETLLHDNF